MKNKPQWLLDAEAEIQKFEETKWGKLSDKEFRKKLGNINGGTRVSIEVKIANGKKQGKKNAESGQVSKAGKKAWETNRDHLLKVASSAGGKTQGKKNVESGHFDNIRDLGTKASVKAKAYLKANDAAIKKAKENTKNKVNKFLSLLPDTEFTIDFARHVVTNEMNTYTAWVYRAMHNTCIQIRPGIWKKKEA